MKTIPLTPVHEALGAKMAEFGGFRMPIEYSGILDEHVTVCQRVGVFDVSHMGEFEVEGVDALAYLQDLCLNDVAQLSVGQAQYTAFPNERGGLVDDLLVYRLDVQRYWLVVNASNIDKDWAWCVQRRKGAVRLTNRSESVAQLAVQGPHALDLLQTLCALPLTGIASYHFVVGEIAGLSNVLISNTGYTGAGGFELYCAPDQVKALWDALFVAGADFGLKPIGLGARDTLRLEMGYCLYGHEIDEDTSPIEAGLSWICSFAAEKNYPSKDLFLQQKQMGVARKRIGLRLLDKGIARQSYELADAEGRVIGVVTSGSISPLTREGIAMGYVETAFAKPGTEIRVSIRGRQLKAVVQRLPFRT